MSDRVKLSWVNDGRGPQRSLRLPISLPVKVREQSSCPMDVELIDISTLGCRIWAGFAMPPGRTTMIIIPGFRPLSSTTVWSREGHAGFRFTTALHPAIVTHVIGMGTIADHNSHERRVRLRTS
jgi:hypothetical protein